MHTNDYDREMHLVKAIAGSFPRFPGQQNALQEADAEILDIRSRNAKFLVLKTDSIHEEIKTGLYNDPYLIGWMSVTACISDLAAVGADPFGILLALHLPSSYKQEWLTAFQLGVNEACSSYDVFVLGGDTSFDKAISITVTGAATIGHTTPLLRTGLLPGHLLYSSGKPGLGNAFAYATFFEPDLQVLYKPLAQLKESKCIRQFATACIDTSDGLFPALSVLTTLNEAGIHLSAPFEEIVHPEAYRIHQHSGIPLWMLLAGPHGDYDLLFTIAPEDQLQLEAACLTDHWQPVLLGHITGDPGLSFLLEGKKVQCHPSLIPNLYHTSAGSVATYYELLKQQHKSWCT